MTLEELGRQLSLEIQTAVGKLGRKVTGGYTSDLLSRVMAQAQAGNVWITLQGHHNIVAVASLLDLSGIIIAEGVTPDPTTLEKAEEHSIPILTTPLTTFTIVGQLFALGIRGPDS